LYKHAEVMLKKNLHDMFSFDIDDVTSKKGKE